MATRIIIGLKPGSDWQQVKRELHALGADSVGEPTTTQPDAVAVTVSSEHLVEEFLARSKALTAVRYAERDQWRSTF